MLVLPVVVLPDLLLAVSLPLFHGAHVNIAPATSRTAMMAAIMPPPMPLRPSSSGRLVSKSFFHVNFSDVELTNPADYSTRAPAPV